MPACSSENHIHRWSSSPPTSRSSSVSPPLSRSPLSTSPPIMSPISTLKRSQSNVSNSSFISQTSTGSNHSTVILSPRHQQLQQQHLQQQLHHQQQHQAIHQHFQQNIFTRRNSGGRQGLLARCILWYVGLMLSVFQGIYKIIACVIWAPAVWASAWICLFWVILQLPLTGLKWFLTILHTPAYERSRSKRCVLISGGSTVQAVHLARNFYKAGARVIVCELEGLFGLARFSTACSRFYTIPRPGPNSAVEYIKALKDIVQREKAVYYIPVSSTSTAYYDALAKPHLEIMGCDCFVPSASEVTALDDPLELLRRCRVLGLPTPVHCVLRTVQDVAGLYEQNNVRNGRYVMLAAGPAGMRDRLEITLPPNAREFGNLQHEISERRPWVVIRDPGGSHFITCTTVKESRVVANVTCRVDEERGGLVPEERPEVTQWLETFFARPFSARVSGHLSFRLALTEDNELVSVGCRVGISFPYVCHSGIHPRLVWKPCRHFSRQNSAVLAAADLKNSVPHAVATALKQPSGEIAANLLGAVLDKREALFTYWDPLPYCAYYHLQLPFNRVAGAIRAQPVQYNPPLAVVQ